jgi:lysyl endopeptidase
MNTFTKLIIATLFIATSASGQYCMLPGRTTYSANQPGITNFKLNTINRTSLNVEKPMNQPSLVVTSDSTNLTRGQTYTVTITHSEDAVIFPGARNNIRVWIDYNKNYSWEDAGETVVTADLKNSGVFTAIFTVPATAPLGKTWLRATAKMSSDAGHSLPTSCDTPPDPIDYHGEMEDYKVNIVAATAIDDVNAGAATIFPIPTTNTINIYFPKISHEKIQADLYDLSGKLVNNILTIEDQSLNNYNIDLLNFTTVKGMYLVRLTLGNTSSYQKLVIE